MKIIIKIRILFWAILGLIIFALLFLAIVPFGSIKYTKDFSGHSYFIEKLTPETRFVSDIKGEGKMIGDPVYFALYTPRRFSFAELTLKYKRVEEDEVLSLDCSSCTAPIIEAGVLVDKNAWRYDLQPIENRILQQLTMAWDTTQEGEILFLQKEKNYSSISEFLENPPDLEKLALYNYNFDHEYLLSDYASSTDEQIIDIALRGAYEFYTYLAGEPLNFTFSFIDINKNKDIDEIDVFLYYNGGLIASKHLDDDDEEGDSGNKSPERIMEFDFANLPKGVYKLEVKVNDDIITNNIKTSQVKLAFNRGLRFDSGEVKNIEIITDSRKVFIKTTDQASQQIIKSRNNNVNINKTYKQFELAIPFDQSYGQLATMTLEKSGVTLAGDGVFSFNKSAYINPRIKKISSELDIKAENIEYVLANYRELKPIDEWLVSKAKFDLNSAYREDGKYNFLISTKGLRADDDIDDYILFDEIIIELNGKTLLEKLKEKF